MKFTAAILGLALLSANCGRAEEPKKEDGAAIYKRLCADCHGAKGEGVAKKYDEPLFGERSLSSLAKYIDKTMPEDEPEKLDAAGSALVAEYIHAAFYSPEARARNNPPKHEIARLTNRQFRESVADLIGSFRPAAPRGPATGLKGEYYQSDGMNKKSKRVFEREDKALDFDFAEGSPGEGITADQFSIAWNGSLIAQETGFYEFKVRTPNGARVYVNADFRDGDRNSRDDSDAKRENTLIDAWVSSGDTVREETAKIFLLGGRAYSFRLDYFKYKDKRGSVRLEWKPPHGAWSVLRAPHISPAPAQRVAVITTPLPADDGSLGFERGTSISKEWHAATTKAAIEAANEVTTRLSRLGGPKKDAPDVAEKCRQWAEAFAHRAFRRPLTPELRELYVNRVFTPEVAPEIGLKRAVIAVLKSPRFLYPEFTEGDDFSTASKLALGMWDSLPDLPLLEAAGRGEVRTPEQVRAQAARMMNDPRARAKIASFFNHWLGTGEAESLAKDSKAFPEFDSALIADLRTSLDRFVEHVVWGEKSDYRELLQADYVFMNERLAKFYGAPVPEGGDFAPVKFGDGKHAGIFTHPFLLSLHSYSKTTSPIHRGVFLTRSIMGRMLKPPPQAIEFKDDRFDPTLTMREKVTELTNKTSCMSCHVTINPLGFALENFDAVGRFRTLDNSKPINPVSDYITSDGDTVKLSGPRDIANHAAGNDAARRGFVRHLFQYTIKQAPAAFGPETLLKLDTQFANGFHIRNLYMESNIIAALPKSEQKQASR
jgi:cytochrome c553